jgi:hypothetical protein
MGWMVGAPPPRDKLVAFADDSWLQFPQWRWSFSNVRQLMPTQVVGRGEGPVTELPLAVRADIDAVTFRPLGRDGTMTWEQSLAANYTDGILILHRGRVVYERYFGVLAVDRPHIAFSVTKSFVATLAAMLIDEGALDAEATVARYLPELATSGAGDATIRQLLDMTTGLDYTEDFPDLKSPGLSRPAVVLRIFRHARQGAAARRSIRVQDREHGRARRRVAARERPFSE